MDRHRFLKQMLLFTALLCGTSFPAKAQNNEITMDNNQRTKTIRLVYPQWQGGDIAHWITEVKDPEQASRGYYERPGAGFKGILPWGAVAEFPCTGQRARNLYGSCSNRQDRA